MTDIIDRLREYAVVSETMGLYTEANCANDAIKEIERLREKNKTLEEYYYDYMDYIHSIGKDE